VSKWYASDKRWATRYELKGGNCGFGVRPRRISAKASVLGVVMEKENEKEALGHWR